MPASRMRSIVLNPSYGNSPYLRSGEIALEVRRLLGEDLMVVMPHIYGENQERIVREQFGADVPIVLDREFGEILRRVSFDGVSYTAFLEHWLATVDVASKTARDYLRATYDIVMEIGRAPFLDLDIHPAFATSWTRTSRILRRAAEEPAITIDRALIQRAVDRMEQLEGRKDRHFVTMPGTFDPGEEDIATPLTMRPPTCDREDLREGIYVTVSGIPGAASIRSMAERFPGELYASDASKLPGAIQAPPNVLAHPAITWHLARAGWGSIWLSLLAAKPLAVPPYEADEDPEIFFNIRRIQELGIGIVYMGQPLAELLAEAPRMRGRMAELRKILQERFGTLDGIGYAARKIVEDLLQKDIVLR